jgi:hypothetical protein
LGHDNNYKEHKMARKKFTQKEFTQKELTQKEWDQANDLSDELMTVVVGKGTSGGVGVVAVAFLMAKALLTLSDNNKAEAQTTLDDTVIPNIILAIDEFEFSNIRYN